jgi:hypothetical protein
MTTFTPPKIVAVEVVASQPTDSDRSVMAHLKARDNTLLEDVAYLVKIQFEEIPPVTSHGWALYVGNERVPKYWAYKGGIYFKVFDPNYFVEHDGQLIQFSTDGVELIDSAKKLVRPKTNVMKAAAAKSKLPL